ncbi:Uncharacterised protein [Turicibacter sanguinis]|nr:Uncharacterised protein [Turicibacter sanguinis]
MSRTTENMGRPKKYSDEFLIQCIYDYQVAYPMDKNVTLSKLSKFTGIPYYIFRDNKPINLMIKSLSSDNTLKSKKAKDITLPSAKDFVEEHYENKKRLIQNVQLLLDLVVQYQMDMDNVENFNSIVSGYKAEIQELKLEIELLKREKESFERELDLIYLDSTSTPKRREKGIAKNLISIEDYNSSDRRLSTNMDDFAEACSIFDE